MVLVGISRCVLKEAAYMHELTSFFPCIQKKLDTTMRENIVIVAETGCNGLLEMAKKRKDEIGEIEEVLQKLQSDLHTIEQRTK